MAALTEEQTLLKEQAKTWAREEKVAAGPANAPF